MNEFDIVYNRHCCLCHSRHKANCYYENCSQEQYNQWLIVAKEELKDRCPQPDNFSEVSA